MRRTSRQEGLVHQDKVQRLSIAFVGGPQTLIDQIETMAHLMGIENVGVNPEIADVVIIQHGNETIGNNQIHYDLAQDGFHLGHRPADFNTGTPSQIQRPGIETILAGCILQEVLRITGCIRRMEIVKTTIQVRMRVDPASLDLNEGPLDSHQAVMDDIIQNSRTSQQIEEGEHVALLIRLDENDDLVRSLLDRVDLQERERPETVEAACIRFTIPIQKEIQEESHIMIVGAGALGTWAMDTIGRGLQNKAFSMTIVDPDREVELHNLNRQILYSENDLGQPKAPAAAERMQEIAPSCLATGSSSMIGLPDLHAIFTNEASPDNSGYEDDIDLLNDEEDSILDINSALRSSNVLVSCVDNLHTRGILSGIAAALDIPLINAGAGGFQGQLDVIPPGDLCMICRYGEGIIHNHSVRSCQEDGEIPFGSIVTSSAIFGALQGLAAIASLNENPLNDWPRSIIWGGRGNKLTIQHTHPPYRRSRPGPHLDHVFMALGGSFSDSTEEELE